MKYISKKDMLFYKAGEEFHISRAGNLVHTASGKMVIPKNGINALPSILTDWFEEVHDKPRTVWDLKRGDKCYIATYQNYGVVISHITWDNTNYMKTLREYGNIFISMEDGIREAKRVEAKQILIQDTKGFKPDFNDSYKDRYYVYYDIDDKELFIDYEYGLVGRNIYFASEEDARASIKNHPKEWKVYLGVEG